MKVVIAGAGTYGAVYHKYISEQGIHEVLGFADDDPTKIGTKICGLEVICETNNYKKLKEIGIEGVFCPIGNNKIRYKILTGFSDNGFATPGFIHDSVIIPEDIIIEKGVYILPGSIIMPFVNIHDYVMISMGVKIAHHTILRKASFISTGANIGANIDFGEYAFAGIGCTLTTGVESIGNGATIGAGAVIIRDVPANAVVVGNPGRILEK